MSVEVLYLQTGETSARQDRWLPDRIFTEGISDVGAGQLAVTQRAGGANMSVDVAPGDGLIAGDSIADQGKYQVRVTAGVNVPIAAAPAAGTRVDLVVLQVHDSTADGGDPANDGAAVEVVTGTVDAGVPATPDSALPLATVTVAAGAGSVFDADLADQRTQLNAVTLDVGTQAIELTTAERDALNAPKAGTLVFNTDTDLLERFTGSSWRPDFTTVDAYGAHAPRAVGTWSIPGGASIPGYNTVTTPADYVELIIPLGMADAQAVEFQGAYSTKGWWVRFTRDHRGVAGITFSEGSFAAIDAVVPPLTDAVRTGVTSSVFTLRWDSFFVYQTDNIGGVMVKGARIEGSNLVLTVIGTSPYTYTTEATGQPVYHWKAW